MYLPRSALVDGDLNTFGVRKLESPRCVYVMVNHFDEQRLVTDRQKDITLQHMPRYHDHGAVKNCTCMVEHPLIFDKVKAYKKTANFLATLYM